MTIEQLLAGPFDGTFATLERHANGVMELCRRDGAQVICDRLRRDLSLDAARSLLAPVTALGFRGEYEARLASSSWLGVTIDSLRGRIDGRSYWGICAEHGPKLTNGPRCCHQPRN